MADACLYFDQGPYFLEVQDFLDWVDLQTSDTLHALGDFLPQLIQQLESHTPSRLHQRLAPVLFRLRSLCHP